MTTKTKATLPQLAEKANKAHAACERAANSMLQYAKQCGEALAKAKTQLPHGEFTTWIEENCRFSPRQARKYLTIARNWEELTKRNRGAVLELDSLSMREALRILGSGGPEETGDWIFTDTECPACGKHLARTIALYITCVHCFDCKLHHHPVPGAKPDYTDRLNPKQDLRNAKKYAEKLPTEQRTDLLATILAVHLTAEGIHAVAEQLKTGPQTDRVVKARDQLMKLVEALKD